MSQSATLYRVSAATFHQLKSTENRDTFDIAAISKSYSIFSGSFMGIEFVLTKEQDETTTTILSEIFNPQQVLSSPDFDQRTPEEQFDYYENGNFIPYINDQKILIISEILNGISEETIRKRYDGAELNAHRIYPEVWHNDNSPDLVYNAHDLVERLHELKIIFQQAAKDKDYILVFIG